MDSFYEYLSCKYEEGIMKQLLNYVAQITG